jgi:hypothetical protein
MKSYTDIEQSKKLAEILPIESADMCYIKHSSSDNPNWEFNEDFPPMILGNVHINEITAETLPCWSLAALLAVLPLIDFIRPILIGTPKTLYKCMYNDDLKSHAYDNPVDACVAMIICLNESNLL